VRLIEQIGIETEAFHAEADEDALTLLGVVTAADYQQFLAATYGFVAPLEQALAATPNLDRVADVRRFQKHKLLRRDLEGFHMSGDAIDRLPRCRVPMFGSAEEALGWAYMIERSTLGHTNLYRHLATAIPGDVAFTATYLKCYFGSVGESWKSFGDSLEAAGSIPAKAERMIDAARAAFRAHRSWRRIQQDAHDGIDEQRA
jgi:heme oxygenase